MRASSADLARETQAERERLATLFGDLSPEQWDIPSLCKGWRVREVVAHITMPFRTRPLGVMAGTVRAGFSFSRYADRDARSAAHDKSGPELVDLLRHNIDNPWQPPGGGGAGALSHDVIHGLDATEPLGLPEPPADRIALVLASAGPRQLSYFGVNLQGQRLTATDADVSVGDGANVVPMTAKDILLIVTGRHPLSRALGTGKGGSRRRCSTRSVQRRRGELAGVVAWSPMPACGPLPTCGRSPTTSGTPSSTSTPAACGAPSRRWLRT